MQPNAVVKEVNLIKDKEMELTFQLTKSLHNKSIPINATLRHYIQLSGKNSILSIIYTLYCMLYTRYVIMSCLNTAKQSDEIKKKER